MSHTAFQVPCIGLLVTGKNILTWLYILSYRLYKYSDFHFDLFKIQVIVSQENYLTIIGRLFHLCKIKKCYNIGSFTLLPKTKMVSSLFISDS